MSNADGSVADLVTAGDGSRVLRSDDEAAIQSDRDGRVANGLETFSRQPSLEQSDLDSGLIICSECAGSPSQYLIDFEEVCPTCGGCGFHDDPDFIDGDTRSFNPHAEFGTYHRVYAGRSR